MGQGEQNEQTEEIKAPEEIMANFVSLAAEGELLAQKGNFTEAIEFYTRALNLKPFEKHCLVARSRCHLQSGSPELALRDANDSLKEDGSFFKGIFQKAEALYAMGDFEMALVFYHRGNKLRPEQDDFRIGIQKSREAIENSIGDPKAVKIFIPQDLKKKVAAVLLADENKRHGVAKTSEYIKTEAQKEKKEAQETIVRNVNYALPQATTPIGNPFNPLPAVCNILMSKGINPPPQSSLSPTMENKLLGEIYEDRVYLSKLLNDKDFVENPNNEVLQLVSEGLAYLSSRLEFWRQQNPLYSRKQTHIRYHIKKEKKGRSTSGQAHAEKGLVLPPIKG